jgi:hypothetical protein
LLANALCHSTDCCLIHRIREQARSHILISFSLSDTEGADQLLELDHLRRQSPLASSGLVRTLGGAFTCTVDLDDVLIDIVCHGGLLFHRGGDLLILIDDHAHCAEDMFPAPAGLFPTAQPCHWPSDG